MNKKHFLNTYKKIDSLDEDKTKKTEQASLYRSEHDERLIKDFHYAKFQKNFNKVQQSDAFKSLLEKENWDDEDIQTFLNSLG
ncbi:MAG: hypothetical protein ABJN96_14385 [Marinomonas sp.]